MPDTMNQGRALVEIKRQLQSAISSTVAIEEQSR